MKRRLILLVFLVCLLNSFPVLSQDSIPNPSNFEEENFLKFQAHFFKALSQKAIFNYSIAIQNLEECNQLKPNDVSVLFEFSKNYYLLNKHIEAIEYGKQALLLDPENRWVLEHLITVYSKLRNFSKAINISQKLTTLNPKKKEQLVYLYLQNNQLNKAKELVVEIERDGNLTTNLKRFKNQFIKKPIQKANKTVENLQSLIKSFESDKNFVTLRKILTLSVLKDNQLLFSYSEKGLALFPAQAFVYLMNGKALNKMKKYKEGLVTLLSGIDFVIDNASLEADFYEELTISYLGLGNKKEAIKNKNKALRLRKKE